MFDLYHYYEKASGPFLNLSDLPPDQAHAILDGIKRENATFAARRFDGYMERRRELERLVRGLFIEKGGKPRREAPHYMVVGECPWLMTWYRDGDFVRIPVSELDMDAVSFTYGDMFPTFSPRVTDNREYRRRVYTYDGIVELIGRIGLPQQWNPDGQLGPERYVEAHVWCDEPIARYIAARGTGGGDNEFCQ